MRLIQKIGVSGYPFSHVFVAELDFYGHVIIAGSLSTLSEGTRMYKHHRAISVDAGTVIHELTDWTRLEKRFESSDPCDPCSQWGYREIASVLKLTRMAPEITGLAKIQSWGERAKENRIKRMAELMRPAERTLAESYGMRNSHDTNRNYRGAAAMPDDYMSLATDLPKKPEEV